MPSQIEKLEAHASHLLDAFIGLRERYALLHPMLFDPVVNQDRGSMKQARGFKTLRYSLFLSCVQDIVKLCRDSCDRTPSIKNVVTALEDPSLRAALEKRYAIWITPSIERETDHEIISALKLMEQHERAQLRAQFVDNYEQLLAIWSVVSASKAMEGFATVRDRVSAHTEIRFVADKYQPVDIGALGIKWGDLLSTIDTMQRMVELIGLIVRNATFSWESFDQQLSTAVVDFWSLPDAAR